LLWIIPAEKFVFRSVSTTVIATLAIIYYIYERYSNNLCIQADLVIAVSILVQFLLPAIFLTFYYDVFPELDFHGYRSGYALTSSAVLLGQLMFFVGYETINKSAYFDSSKTTPLSFRYMLFIFLPLLFVVWASRYILLSTGTYYHIFRSEFQFVNPSASIISLINNMGEVPLIAAFVIAFQAKNKRKKRIILCLALVLFVIELFWYMPAGRTAEVIIVILSPLFAYIYIYKKISKLHLVISFIVVLTVLVFFRGYRYYVTADQFKVDEIRITTLPRGILETSIKSNNDLIAPTVDRLYEAKSLAYLLLNYTDDYELEYGENYKEIWTVIIPRTMWPDKPNLMTHFTDYYQLIAAGMIPLTFLGESYINFSWFGIIIMSYLLGLFMKGYDSIFMKNASNAVWIYFYLYGAIWTIRNIPLHTAVSGVSFLSKIVIFAFIFGNYHLFVSAIIKKHPLCIAKDNGI